MRASVMAICDVVADVNHLVPYRRYWPFSSRATVDVPLTSEPPVRSVIHCPDVQNCSGSREVRCCSAVRFSSSSPYSSMQRAAPSLIASGQLYVADDGEKRYCRANWWTRDSAPCARSYPTATGPSSTAMRSSQLQPTDTSM